MKSLFLWKQNNRRWYQTGLAGLLIMLLIGAAGCGKKGLPIPPPQEIPPPVMDLAVNRDGLLLTLSWSIPKGKNADQLIGFKIYRSQTALQDKDCQDCPVKYRLFDEVLIQESTTRGPENNQMVFSRTLKSDEVRALNAETPPPVDTPPREEQPPESAAVYQYKVVGYTENGVRSPDSNLARTQFSVPTRENQEKGSPNES